MPGKANIFENDLLLLIFENTDAPLIGDATGLRGSTVAGSLHISLHTGAGPGEAGDQTTNEAAYTGYLRVAVARAGAQWTTAAGQTQNTNLIAFPTSTSGPETETEFAVGTAAHPAAGKILYFGALTASLIVNNGITPQFGALDLTVTED